MEKWCRAGNAFLPHSRGLENMSNATCATCIALHRDTVSCGVGFFCCFGCSVVFLGRGKSSRTWEVTNGVTMYNHGILGLC